MKNLKCFIFGHVFTVFIFLTIPHNLFAKITNFNPVKTANEEALDVFLIAENEFKKGRVLQKKCDYENAITCYIKSLRLWQSDETHLNLTCCFYEIRLFFTAEKMALLGLQATAKNRDSLNYIRFLVLLGAIYYESENYERALTVYKNIPLSSVDKDARDFIAIKIKDIENNILSYSP